MCWCHELRENKQGQWKWTKPPLQVDSRYAQSDQPRTWTSFKESGSTTSHRSEPSPMALGSDPRETSSGLISTTAVIP